MIKLNRRFIKRSLAALGLIALAFMAWPKFERFQCRSIQSEAKAWLQHLYEAEKYYHAKHQEYASIEMLIHNGLVPSREKNYTYHSSLYNSKSFEIIAQNKSKSGFNEDIWSIDQNALLKSVSNACTY